PLVFSVLSLVFFQNCLFIRCILPLLKMPYFHHPFPALLFINASAFPERILSVSSSPNPAASMHRFSSGIDSTPVIPGGNCPLHPSKSAPSASTFSPPMDKTASIW